ncbi:P-loop containing nucleoside triphosphate hydrolase protein [Rhodofomes roseus]|uniref:P-loop containing nucleoside triphosphate hydrolase protein n=1 Tax=Rhodofomes roseus TaxID=34475 RepID=A0ABQ8JXJ5_9APHY|nr:P-loop containing nucleoside triphosphate hydrolase protein [Rhodofomes roseus]KAH9828575.1 P-loop containing nucleoside triphosphate hydrolase protein [Rhodofomes roseus]
MPVWKLHETLFDVAATIDTFVEDGCWNELTGLDTVPWDEADPEEAWLENDQRLLKAVRTFLAKYRAVQGDMTKQEFLRQKDQYNNGRDAVLRWFKARLGVWNVRVRFIGVLEENGMGPYRVMQLNKAQKARPSHRCTSTLTHLHSQLPSMEQCQVNSQYTNIARELFGDAVALENSNLLVMWAPQVIGRMTAWVWHGEATRIKREIGQLEKEAAELDQKWEAVIKNPTSRSIKAYVKRMENKIAISRKFDNGVVCQAFERQLQRVADLRTQMEDTTVNVPGLPKQVFEAIRLLANEEEVRALTTELDLILSDEVADPIEINVDGADAPEMDWGTGVEEYEGFSEDELWAMLGRAKEKTIPFFNTAEAATGVHDPWSPKGIEAMTATDAVPLRPHWHQLIGVVKMLDNYLRGDPTLLMDGVGVGKTMQVVGVVCCLAFFHAHYAQHGHFPGKFANIKYHREGNTPSEPTLIVVPVALERQVVSEIHRYVRPKTFDLISYTSSVRGAKGAAFWEAVDNFAQPPERQIIVATNPAVEKDGAELFTKLTDRPWNLGTRRQRKAATLAKAKAPTVYNRHWSLMICDEVHTMRRVNQLFVAVRGLREQAGGMIGMTATPTITNALDLASLGRLLGVDKFSDDHFAVLDEFRKSLGRAASQDRKNRKDADKVGKKGKGKKAAKAASQEPKGQGNAESVSQSVVETVRIMTDFRARFFGKVCRRTIESMHQKGQDFEGLPPAHRIQLMLRLAKYEQEMMAELAGTTRAAVGTSHTSASDKSFYIDLRRATFHLSQSSTTEFPEPKSKEEFEQMPTAKLAALVDIIHHHRTPKAPPLNIKTELRDPDFKGYSTHHGSGPDKMIVFSYFPSNNNLLRKVFDFYGIKAVFLNGKLSAAQRERVVEDFRKAGADGPTVLVMSSVGATGLNLAWANIMIFVDTTWSAQEDEQAIGRILRFGQKSDVLIYYLITLASVDVLLNTIAFDKGVMHQAFMEADFELKRVVMLLLGNKIAHLIGDADVELPADPEEDDDGTTASSVEVEQALTPRKRKQKKAAKTPAIFISDDEAEPSEKGDGVDPPKKGGKPTTKRPQPRRRGAKAKAVTPSTTTPEPESEEDKTSTSHASATPPRSPPPRPPPPPPRPAPRRARDSPPAEPRASLPPPPTTPRRLLSLARPSHRRLRPAYAPSLAEPRAPLLPPPTTPPSADRPSTPLPQSTRPQSTTPRQGGPSTPSRWRQSESHTPPSQLLPADPFALTQKFTDASLSSSAPAATPAIPTSALNAAAAPPVDPTPDVEMVDSHASDLDMSHEDARMMDISELEEEPRRDTSPLSDAPSESNIPIAQRKGKRKAASPASAGRPRRGTPSTYVPTDRLGAGDDELPTGSAKRTRERRKKF